MEANTQKAKEAIEPKKAMVANEPKKFNYGSQRTKEIQLR